MTRIIDTAIIEAIKNGEDIIVSSDSLRECDILPEFLKILAAGTDEVQEIMYDSKDKINDIIDVCDDAVQAIVEEFGLPFEYVVGSHMNDGTCFGIWREY